MNGICTSSGATATTPLRTPYLVPPTPGVSGQWATAAGLRTFVVHWNGQGWKQVDSPNPPGANVNQLNHVVATSADDAWVVGYEGQLSVHYETLAEHWHGHTWNIVSSSNPPGSPNSDLSDVTALSPTNVWAAGYTYDSTLARFVTLAEHWGGHTWTRVSSPSSPDHANTFILGLHAVSTNDIWAVGWNDKGTGDEPFAMHCDGHRWKVVDTPVVPGTSLSIFEATSGTSATDAWAVGMYQSGGQYLGWSSTGMARSGGSSTRRSPPLGGCPTRTTSRQASDHVSSGSSQPAEAG